MIQDNKEEEREDYGMVTLGGGGNEQRKVPIESFLQAQYKDHRLFSIVKFDGVYGLSIENPPSTGRSSQNMHLTEESLIALISTSIMYLQMSGKDIGKMLVDASNRDSIQCSYSKDLDKDIF